MGGDVDYTVHGQGYGQVRRADPRIAAQVHAALGDARTVLNVGAGAGSYEPADRRVIAVEPAAAMRAQRPPNGAPVVSGLAETLPLGDQSVDASMATVTVHQWSDLGAGLAELRRVTRGPVVILTADPAVVGGAWFEDYQPERVAVERRRMPPVETLAAGLSQGWGGRVDVEIVPVPLDCTDGFAEAF
ncbi:MAG: methyltransferase domain-containing protein, partial [Hyphomonadaceae bacterium]|nr:methyltransferase domain-containing protein [Hyphomonadaceae bacterium]